MFPPDRHLADSGVSFGSLDLPAKQGETRIGSDLRALKVARCD